jgi:hypothetical protein
MIPIILLNFKKNVCFNTIHQILGSETSVQTWNIDLLQNHVHWPNCNNHRSPSEQGEFVSHLAGSDSRTLLGLLQLLYFCMTTHTPWNVTPVNKANQLILHDMLPQWCRFSNLSKWMFTSLSTSSSLLCRSQSFKTTKYQVTHIHRILYGKTWTWILPNWFKRCSFT